MQEVHLRIYEPQSLRILPDLNELYESHHKISEESEQPEEPNTDGETPDNKG